MAASEELGIIGLHSFHYYVHDLERSRRFYEQGFGWVETARTSDALAARTGQRCSVFQAGTIRAAVSAPTEDMTRSPRARRWLRRHPDGVGSLSFEVRDIETTWRALLARDATPVSRIEAVATRDGGQWRQFLITTAIGDVAFRFVERRDTAHFAPGFDIVRPEADAAGLGFRKVDHITCNAQTMTSVKLWLEHVMGMEQCWDIEFHTEDIKQGGEVGTGLRSVVMWDPGSGLKFPINEPLAPFFKEGQINRFIEDNAGAGVQHIALEVDDVCAKVEALRARDVAFLHTPPVYYDAVPARLAAQGVDVGRIAHGLDRLAPLGILIDGKPTDNYLIQIFLEDAMTLYGEPSAGPFFFELIQRCGDDGFGGGNFRALFEAIERYQQDGAARPSAGVAA